MCARGGEIGGDGEANAHTDIHTDLLGFQGFTIGYLEKRGRGRGGGLSASVCACAFFFGIVAQRESIYPG